MTATEWGLRERLANALADKMRAQASLDRVGGFITPQEALARISRATATARNEAGCEADYRCDLVREDAAAGDRCTATAGYRGIIVIRYWDDKAARFRLIEGYVGENDIEPNVPYRVVNAKLVRGASLTPETAFTALRELLHGAGIPSRSPNGASDKRRAVTPTRRALPTLLDVAEVFCGACILVVLVFALISV